MGLFFMLHERLTRVNYKVIPFILLQILLIIVFFLFAVVIVENRHQFTLEKFTL